MEMLMQALAAPAPAREVMLDDRRAADEPVRPARSPRSKQLRHPWADVQHPASAADEQRFVDQLRAIAACSEPVPGPDFTRTEVTALVNALRGGLDAIDLLRRAPGLVPGRLVAAYDHIERERATSVAAWEAIVADPVAEVVLQNAPLAARLLPVVVVELAEYARRNDPQLTRRLQLAEREIARVGAVARRLEGWMDDPVPHAMDATEVGQLLFDVEGPGLWSHNFFLAPRVGALVPVRLATLLGEQVPATAGAAAAAA